MALEIKKPAKKKTTGGKKDWGALKEEFIAMNLQEEISLLKFAQLKGCDYDHLKDRAAEDGWIAAKVERRKARDEMMAAKAVEAITDLRVKQQYSESQVRDRHANIGQHLQVKAYKKLQDIKPEDLTIEQMLACLKLGVFFERQALGLPDEVVEGHHQHGVYLSKAHEEFERELSLNRAADTHIANGMRLLEAKRKAVPAEVIDETKGKKG